MSTDGGWSDRRKAIVVFAIPALLLVAATTIEPIRNLVLGRNACGQRAVPRDSIHNLDASFVVRSVSYADECHRGSTAFPVVTMSVEARGAERSAVDEVQAAIVATGWRVCPWHAEGGCVQAPDRHHYALVVAPRSADADTRLVSVMVMDRRNPVDCSKGCG